MWKNRQCESGFMSGKFTKRPVYRRMKHSIRIRFNPNLMSFKTLCQRIFSDFFALVFPYVFWKCWHWGPKRVLVWTILKMRCTAACFENSTLCNNLVGLSQETFVNNSGRSAWTRASHPRRAPMFGFGHIWHSFSGNFDF